MVANAAGARATSASTSRCSRDVRHRHIEQQEPAARVRRPAGRRRRVSRCGGTPPDRRPTPTETARRHARTDAPDRRRCREAGARAAGVTIASASSSSVRARARGNPGVAGHRRKVRQRLVGVRIEEGPRRHRLDAEPGRRRQPFAREQRRREPGRQLRQAEAIQAERGAPRPRPLAHEVVGGAARRRHDQHFSGGRRLEKKAAGGVEPDRGRRGFDDLQQ